MHPECNPSKIVKNADGTLTLYAKGPGGVEVVIDKCDHVLMATGRKPNVKNLGLEEVRKTCYPLVLNWQIRDLWPGRMCDLGD